MGPEGEPSREESPSESTPRSSQHPGLKLLGPGRVGTSCTNGKVAQGHTEVRRGEEGWDLSTLLSQQLGEVRFILQRGKVRLREVMCRPRAPQWLRMSVPRAPFPGPGGHSHPSPPCVRRNPARPPFPRKNQFLSLPPAPKAQK